MDAFHLELHVSPHKAQGELQAAWTRHVVIRMRLAGVLKRAGYRSLADTGICLALAQFPHLQTVILEAPLEELQRNGFELAENFAVQSNAQQLLIRSCEESCLQFFASRARTDAVDGDTAISTMWADVELRKHWYCVLTWSAVANRLMLAISQRVSNTVFGDITFVAPATQVMTRAQVDRSEDLRQYYRRALPRRLRTLGIHREMNLFNLQHQPMLVVPDSTSGGHPIAVPVHNSVPMPLISRSEASGTRFWNSALL